MTGPDDDAAIARRWLGPGATPFPIGATLHAVTGWAAGDRGLVIKRYPGAGGAEADALRRADPTGFVPRLIEAGPDHLVLERVDGAAALDVLDPTRLADAPDVLLAFVVRLAAVHAALPAVPAGAASGPVPGPVAWTHGDLLPHNVLIDRAGLPVLIDFDRAGPGPLLLDLIGMLAVLPRAAALALVHAYWSERGWRFEDADHVAAAQVLRDWPALRLARLRQQRGAIFRERPDQFARMERWLTVAAEIQGR